MDWTRPESGKSSEAHKEPSSSVLKEFVLDVWLFAKEGGQGQSIDETLRMFLSTFRLPGEAQCMEKIVERFSDTYASTVNNEIKLTLSSFKASDEGQIVSSQGLESYVTKSRTIGLVETSTPCAQGRQMFTLLWDGAISMVAYYLFRTPPELFYSKVGTEAKILAKVRTSFEQIGLI